MPETLNSLRRAGAPHLFNALKPNTGAIVAMVLFSVVVNFLTLTGPMFMLQVYDRVLSSRSEETLVVLLILVVILYGIMGVLDYSRGRVAARVGAGFQNRLDNLVLRQNIDAGGWHFRDLEAIQRFMSSAAIFAVLDLPWTLLFIAAIFVFHPLLGWLAICGGGVLILLAVMNRWLSASPADVAQRFSLEGDQFAETLGRNDELVRGLSMQSEVIHRWSKLRNKALEAQIRSSDRNGMFSVAGRTLRLFLQSAILALGAFLVLDGEMTSGGIIAASILTGRALAPIEQTISQWPIIQRARNGWRNLSFVEFPIPTDAIGTLLGATNSILEVSRMVVSSDFRQEPMLAGIDFVIQPGQVLGVIGPSGSGKTSLARALTGVISPISGSVRLGGATLRQHGEELGKFVGYLPQDVQLFDATVAENIARLELEPDSKKVIAAAKSAGVHETILGLKDGYDTRIAAGKIKLSGGEKQRIGLARALYNRPVLLVLDEPNASLDAEGVAALNLAVRNFRRAGKSVVIMAHRPSGIDECDLLLVLKNGRQVSFGPRDEVLRSSVRNQAEVVAAFRSEGRA